MTEILRTEEWSATEGGFTSTAIVNVFKGDEVHLSDSVMKEFGLPTDGYREEVNYAGNGFVWAVPYDTFKPAIEAKGFKRDDPS